MREITLEELLEAGCHFGHQVTRQNPKARDFVFEARDNIHIIDLAKTKEGLDNAIEFIKSLAEKGGSLIVIGTKRQAKGIVEEEVKRAHSTSSGQADDGLFYVTNRWIGGTLTNFSEVTKNFKKLKDFEERLQSDEEKAKYTKKEVGQWAKEKAKLESFYGGISDMKKVPDALFMIDTHLEELAVKEAHKMGVTTVGVVDTNADPFVIDYPIPANDDAVGSIKLIIAAIIDAWIEGKKIGEKAAEQPVSKEGKVEVAEKPKAKTKRTVVSKTKVKPKTKKTNKK